MKLAHAKKDYTAIADEIDILRNKKQELLVQRAETEGVKKRVAELTDFLQDEAQELTEYDEYMVRKYIEQIKVYEDKFTVCFKAKVEIEIKRIITTGLAGSLLCPYKGLLQACACRHIE